MTTRSRYLLFACLIMLAVVMAGVAEVWIDFHENYRRQQVMAMDMARVVEAHVDDTVRQADNILGLVADMVAEAGSPQAMRRPDRWKMLRALCDGLVGCHSIAVIDTTGRVAALSASPDAPDIDTADRLYFRKATETRRLFIGPALATRLPGNPILFAIARPVVDGRGTLLGVVTAGMDTRHIAAFYGLMSFGKNPAVTVYKRNGDIVARHPDMQDHVGKNDGRSRLFATELARAPEGIFESTSALDGKDRIAAYRSLPARDLVIYAGVERDVATRGWQMRTRRTAIIVGFVLALLAVILHFGYRVFARQVTLEESNRELSQLARTDGLTQLANRRVFDTVLEREWQRHQREQTPLSLLVIDIDFFKAYNDNHGHQAGDDCLYQVAQALRASAQRDVDLVARYGGEEFAVVLNADATGAAIVAERMRRGVEALGIGHVASSVGMFVTVSVGIGSTTLAACTSAEALLSAADDALYEAKRNGRNAVHPPLAPSSVAILPARRRQG